MDEFTRRLEQNTCAAMTLNDNALIEGLRRFKDDDFYYVENRLWFQGLVDMFNEGKRDLTGLYEILERKYNLDFAETSSYILNCLDGIVSPSQIIMYDFQILKEKTKMRKLQAFLYEAYTETKNLEAISSDIAYAVIDKITDIIQDFNTEGLRTIQDDLTKIYSESLDSFTNPEAKKVRSNMRLTGFSELDEITGLKEEDLVIIGARPAMGKTSFALSLALGISKQKKLETNKNYVIAVFSLEMSKEQLTRRLLSIDSEINKKKFDYLDKDELDKLAKSVLNLQTLDIWIDDTSGITPAYIKAEVTKLKQKLKYEGKELGAVFVDYIGLMESGEVKIENTNSDIGKISKSLKQMARSLKVPVIALSQLSRAVEKRQNKRPNLSDLRDSGSIEQDADLVMFIYRDEYYNPDSSKKKTAEIITAKNREGEVCTHEMFFDASITKFGTLERG